MPVVKAIPRGTLAGPSGSEKVSVAGKAKIFYRPYAAPAESPDGAYDLWLCTGRVLEHWHSGTMTRRVPEHAIADLLPIVADGNACLDCHDRASAADSGATALPESHYRDLRNAPDTVGATVAGARFLCTTCHVARTDTEPLVPNRFRP